MIELHGITATRATQGLIGLAPESTHGFFLFEGGQS